MKLPELKRLSPRHIGQQLRDLIEAVFLLRREDAASYQARLWHGILLITTAFLILGGLFLLLLSPTDRPTPTGALGGLALTGALGIFLLERIISLLYGYPLKSARMEESFLMRHPLVALLLTACLHLVAALSTDALILLRGSAASGPEKVVGMLLLGLAAGPFWALLLHVRQAFQKAGKLRQQRKQASSEADKQADKQDEEDHIQGWRKQLQQLWEFLRQLRQQDS